MKTTKFIFLGLMFAAGIISCTGNAGHNDQKQDVQKMTEVADVNGVIVLNAPDTTRGVSVMQALKERKSVREYAGRKLSLEDLSDLLWAANGINRPSDGKRTAASAMNAHDIDVYVCLKEGAYLYNPKDNRLDRITREDLRPAVAGQQTFVENAPACLVLVSDTACFPVSDVTHTLMTGAMDAGIVSANISTFCSSVGLATVPRATMNTDALRTALKLKDSQLPIMNHPVGYLK